MGGVVRASPYDSAMAVGALGYVIGGGLLAGNDRGRFIGRRG